MSLSIPYENVGDAQMRLQGSVVLYDGEPVYIREVTQVGAGDPKGDVFRVYAEPLPLTSRERNREDEFRKFISSKKFDMAPFPMGFMNWNGDAVYIHRRARRQQRQGFSEGTFGADFVSQNPNGTGINFGTCVKSKEFVDCIKGKYPSVSDATKIIMNDKARSVAFSRTFALVRDLELVDLIYLYHKQEKVGFITGDALKLSKVGQCLKESLREVGVKC